MPIFPSRPGPSKFRLVPVEFAVVPPIPVPESTIYGLLYNWYATADVRNICADGWHIPLSTDGNILMAYLGGWQIAGGKLKEEELIYWNAPNTGADNNAGFNGRGSGARSYHLGLFDGMKNTFDIWGADNVNATEGWMFVSVNYASAIFARGGYEKSWGLGLRPVKDSTSLSHGEIGSYTDPSGYIYPTICIGTQEWVSCNIKTQHYRNGDSIPEVTDNAAWAALTSGALCAYKNNWDNV